MDWLNYVSVKKADLTSLGIKTPLNDPSKKSTIESIFDWVLDKAETAVKFIYSPTEVLFGHSLIYYATEGLKKFFGIDITPETINLVFSIVGGIIIGFIIKGVTNSAFVGTISGYAFYSGTSILLSGKEFFNNFIKQAIVFVFSIACYMIATIFTNSELMRIIVGSSALIIADKLIFPYILKTCYVFFVTDTDIKLNLDPSDYAEGGHVLTRMDKYNICTLANNSTKPLENLLDNILQTINKGMHTILFTDFSTLQISYFPNKDEFAITLAELENRIKNITNKKAVNLDYEYRNSLESSYLKEIGKIYTIDKKFITDRTYSTPQEFDSWLQERKKVYNQIASKYIHLYLKTVNDRIDFVIKQLEIEKEQTEAENSFVDVTSQSENFKDKYGCEFIFNGTPATFANGMSYFLQGVEDKIISDAWEQALERYPDGNTKNIAIYASLKAASYPLWYGGNISLDKIEKNTTEWGLIQLDKADWQLMNTLAIENKLNDSYYKQLLSSLEKYVNDGKIPLSNIQTVIRWNELYNFYRYYKNGKCYQIDKSKVTTENCGYWGDLNGKIENGKCNLKYFENNSQTIDEKKTAINRQYLGLSCLGGVGSTCGSNRKQVSNQINNVDNNKKLMECISETNDLQTCMQKFSNTN